MAIVNQNNVLKQDDQYKLALDDNTTIPSTSITSNGTSLSSSISSVTWQHNLASNPVTAATSPYTYTINDTYTISNSYPKTFKIEGDAEVSGDIKIKGVNLSDRLDAIEERLGILRSNDDLEGKWANLKSLGEEYRKLEREILEQEKVWEILKK